MKIKAEVVCDSVSPSDERLTTFVLTYPRFIHSEVMTHRALSRNAASSRAIPITKMLSAVWRTPAMPIHWGANQPGMQARVHLSPVRTWMVKQIWLLLRIPTLIGVWLMAKIGLHKQVANRLLEPWMWITVVASATEWENLFKLRIHEDAQPEFCELATQMRAAKDNSWPRVLNQGEWHLPFITQHDRNFLNIDNLKMVSAARCAAVSYVRQGEIRDHAKDFNLYERLVDRDPRHDSPLEHVAMASGSPVRSGNFVGFVQLRKELEGK